MDPGTAAGGGAVLRSALGEHLRVSQFSPAQGTASPWQQWNDLMRLQPGLVAGAVAGLIGAGLHHTRRPEYGLRRVLGSTPSQISALCAVEGFFVLVPAAMLAAGIAYWLIFLGPLTITQHTLALVAGTCVCANALGLGLFVLGGLLAAHQRPVETLRDR